MKGHTIHVKKMHLPRGMNRTKGGSRFDTVATVVHRPHSPVGRGLTSGPRSCRSGSPAFYGSALVYRCVSFGESRPVPIAQAPRTPAVQSPRSYRAHSQYRIRVTATKKPADSFGIDEGEEQPRCRSITPKHASPPGPVDRSRYKCDKLSYLIFRAGHRQPGGFRLHRERGHRQAKDHPKGE